MSDIFTINKCERLKSFKIGEDTTITVGTDRKLPNGKLATRFSVSSTQYAVTGFHLQKDQERNQTPEKLKNFLKTKFEETTHTHSARSQRIPIAQDEFIALFDKEGEEVARVTFLSRNEDGTFTVQIKRHNPDDKIQYKGRLLEPDTVSSPGSDHDDQDSGPTGGTTP